jgi:hypothetical protein
LNPFIENIQVIIIMIKSIFQKYIKKNPEYILG